MISTDDNSTKNKVVYPENTVSLSFPPSFPSYHFNTVVMVTVVTDYKE